MTPDRPTPTDAAQWRRDAERIRDTAVLVHLYLPYVSGTLVPDLEVIAARLEALPAVIEEQVRAAWIEGVMYGDICNPTPEGIQEVWLRSAAYARLHPGGEGEQG